MENERIEKIKDSIEETETEISNIQIVIQQLIETRNTAKRTDEKSKIQEVINSFSSEISFLEMTAEEDRTALDKI